jgi:hypothetical protein
MKTRLIAVMAGLGILAVLSGCIEVNQTVTVKKDGSGTISDETVMGAQMVAMMAGFGGGGAPGAPDPMAKMYDEAQYKAKAANYGEGVEYVKLEKVERNGGKGVKVHYKFADINKLSFEPGGGMDDMAGSLPGAGAAKPKKAPWKIAFADGKLTITAPDAPEGIEKPDVPEGAGEGMPPEAAAMFAGMRMTAALVIEPGIAKTNATHVEGNKITLMDIKMDEVLQNPEAMKAMQGVDMKDRKAMEEALKDVKGVKVETQKTIEVLMK